jgi:hypothetical protein
MLQQLEKKQAATHPLGILLAFYLDPLKAHRKLTDTIHPPRQEANIMAYSDKILERSIDPTVHQMLARAEQLGLETVWDRYEKMLPECGFGELGVCCRNCNMGPCRISPFEDEGPQRGICGATADIIVARNLIRMIAGGAAAHSDHGRDLAHTLLLTAEGKSGGYDIKACSRRTTSTSWPTGTNRCSRR